MYLVTATKTVNGASATLYSGTFEFSIALGTWFEASGVNFVNDGATLTIVKVYRIIQFGRHMPSRTSVSKLCGLTERRIRTRV